MRNDDQHPTRDTLRKFGLGQLEPDQIANVERHVAACDACAAVVAQMGDDTLLAKLKRYDGLAETVAVTSSPKTTPIAVSDSSVPVALANHSRYSIVKELGHGGMGVVYQARHRMMDRLVALKVINPKWLRNQSAVDRFHFEVKAAAKLSHPNIVTAFDAEQAGDFHFLVMEYVDGITLDAYVKKNGPLDVKLASGLIRQAAQGLQHAWSKGMVHRDIKPQNLMLMRNGRLKILDFGLARIMQEETEPNGSAPLTVAGMRLGTPDYMSPEQIQDPRGTDVRSDIYSLGCTMYFALAGRAPFENLRPMEKLEAQLHQLPTPVAQVRPDVPSEICGVVDKMMSKAPEYRFATPSAVVEALAPFCRPSAATEPTPATAEDLAPFSVPLNTFVPPTTYTASRRKGKPLVPIMIGSVVLLLAVGIGIAISSRDSGTPGGVKKGSTQPKSQPQTKSQPQPQTKSQPQPQTKSQPVPVPNVAKGATTTDVKTARVLVVVPFVNYWEPDLSNVLRQLNSARVRVDLASSRTGEARAADNRGQTTIPLALANCDPASYDAVIFTGAYPTNDLEFAMQPRQREVARSFVSRMNQDRQMICAICGGIAVLATNGNLDGREAAWNEYLPRAVQDRTSVRWNRDTPTSLAGNILTARREYDAEPFVAALLERVGHGRPAN